MGQRVRHLGLPFAIAFVGTLIAVAIAWTLCPDAPAKWLLPYCTELDANACQPSAAIGTQPTAPADAKYEREWAVAKARIANYQSDSSALRTNLWLQVTFLLFALMILLRQESDEAPFEIPLLKIHIPRAWCHLILPLVLTYLYVTFGFLFDHLIQGRYILGLQLAQLERPRIGSSIHSMRMLIEDRWLMDSWFLEFHPDQIAMPLRTSGVIWFNRVMLGLFTMFIAIQHAISIFLLSRKELPGGTRSAATVLVGVICVLGFSHVGFMVFGGNPNWVQLGVGVGSLVILLVLTMRYPVGWGTRQAREETNLSREPMPAAASLVSLDQDVASDPQAFEHHP